MYDFIDLNYNTKYENNTDGQLIINVPNIPFSGVDLQISPDNNIDYVITDPTLPPSYDQNQYTNYLYRIICRKIDTKATAISGSATNGNLANSQSYTSLPPLKNQEVLFSIDIVPYFLDKSEYTYIANIVDQKDKSVSYGGFITKTHILLFRFDYINNSNKFSKAPYTTPSSPFYVNSMTNGSDPRTLNNFFCKYSRLVPSLIGYFSLDCFKDNNGNNEITEFDITSNNISMLIDYGNGNYKSLIFLLKGHAIDGSSKEFFCYLKLTDFKFITYTPSFDHNIYRPYTDYGIHSYIDNGSTIELNDLYLTDIDKIIQRCLIGTRYLFNYCFPYKTEFSYTNKLDTTNLIINDAHYCNNSYINNGSIEFINLAITFDNITNANSFISKKITYHFNDTELINVDAFTLANPIYFKKQLYYGLSDNYKKLILLNRMDITSENSSSLMLKATNPTAVYDSFNISVGDKGVRLSHIIKDICVTSGIPKDQIDVSELESKNIKLSGYSIGSIMTAKTALTNLMQYYSIDCVESGDTLKFKFRHKVPLLTIDEGEFIRESETSFTDTLKQEIEIPYSVNINFINSDKDYQQDSVGTKRIKTSTHMNSNQEINVDAPICVTKDVVLNIAKRLLYDLWNERRKFSFKLSWKYITLEPTDSILLSFNDGSTIQVRITKIDIGTDFTLAIEAVSEGVYHYNYTKKPPIIDLFPEEPIDDEVIVIQDNVIIEGSLIVIDTPLELIKLTSTSSFTNKVNDDYAYFFWGVTDIPKQLEGYYIVHKNTIETSLSSDYTYEYLMDLNDSPSFTNYSLVLDNSPIISFLTWGYTPSDYDQTSFLIVKTSSVLNTFSNDADFFNIFTNSTNLIGLMFEDSRTIICKYKDVELLSTDDKGVHTYKLTNFIRGLYATKRFDLEREYSGNIKVLFITESILNSSLRVGKLHLNYFKNDPGNVNKVSFKLLNYNIKRGTTIIESPLNVLKENLIDINNLNLLKTYIEHCTNKGFYKIISSLVEFIRDDEYLYDIVFRRSEIDSSELLTYHGVPSNYDINLWDLIINGIFTKTDYYLKVSDSLEVNPVKEYSVFDNISFSSQVLKTSNIRKLLCHNIYTNSTVNNGDPSILINKIKNGSFKIICSFYYNVTNYSIIDDNGVKYTPVLKFIYDNKALNYRLEHDPLLFLNETDVDEYKYEEVYIDLLDVDYSGNDILEISYDTNYTYYDNTNINISNFLQYMLKYHVTTTNIRNYYFNFTISTNNDPIRTFVDINGKTRSIIDNTITNHNLDTSLYVNNQFLPELDLTYPKVFYLDETINCFNKQYYIDKSLNVNELFAAKLYNSFLIGTLEQDGSFYKHILIILDDTTVDFNITLNFLGINLNEDTFMKKGVLIDIIYSNKTTGDSISPSTVDVKNRFITLKGLSKFKNCPLYIRNVHINNWNNTKQTCNLSSDVINNTDPYNNSYSLNYNRGEFCTTVLMIVNNLVGQVSSKFTFKEYTGNINSSFDYYLDYTKMYDLDNLPEFDFDFHTYKDDLVIKLEDTYTKIDNNQFHGLLRPFVLLEDSNTEGQDYMTESPYIIKDNLRHYISDLLSKTKVNIKDFKLIITDCPRPNYLYYDVYLRHPKIGRLNYSKQSFKVSVGDL